MLHELLHNEAFVFGVMALIIFIVTNILKIPIKWVTKRFIKNERKRKIANGVILVIPFVLGVAFDYIYSCYYLHTAFSVITGLGYGSAGISLYSIIERFFKVKISNPYEGAEGEAVQKLIGDITEDGVVDEKDQSALNEFWATINK